MSKDIRKVYDLEGLLEYFSSELDWNIDMGYIDDIEDVVYEFDANDLGLKQEAFAKIKSLYQLQPMYNNQPWGIFCIDFDSEKLQVTALRKVLSGLIPKKRNSENHAVWDQKHLLFLCFWGTGDNRTIGVARFEEKPNGGLPEIKIIYCSPAKEEYDQIRVFEDRLSKLRFPSDPSHAIKWLLDWSEAFTTAYRQTIKNSQQLAQCLAVEAKKIHDTIIEILDVETGSGYVHKIYKNFKETLVHDLSESDFADMYAQTIVYGLFSARCMDDTVDNFSAEEAVDCMPITNPFLKSMMQECIKIGNTKTTLSFDELGVSDVVSLLKHTDAREITKDFNRQTGSGKEDPVIHFYEEFLTAYNKEQKVQRGVFYTPQPVVKFMVNAVDDILRNEFGLKDGLASTETKIIKGMVPSKVSKHKLVKGDIEVPAVQILDPATGTGTYLRQIIIKIHETFVDNLPKGTPYLDICKEWSNYVPKHLLPRLNAFELMMAPYAVAHMKLAMVLKQTGYDFHSDKRLNVFLTNSLEEPGDDSGQFKFETDPLADESVEANGIKKDKGINVVIGNPPYSGESSNKGVWITKLMEEYKKEPGGVVKLNERNPKWINDDYVKFIRLGQYYLNKTDSGILAYINPHGFIDNPTFRGMRWNILRSFDAIYIIDIHGNSNRKERCPDGSKDENVFDIQQGVSINIFVKNPNDKKTMAEVYHTDIWGLRDKKYEMLSKSSMMSLNFERVDYQSPLFLFRKQDNDLKNKYEAGFSVVDLFPCNGVGLTTAHDNFVIDFDKESLIEKFSKFKESDPTDDLYELFGVKRKTGWNILDGWKNLQECDDISGFVEPITYRPFDNRFVFYEDKLVWRTVRKVMNNFILGDNIGLITARSNKSDDCSHFYISKYMMETKCGERTTQSAIFPLFIYKDNFGKIEKTPNLDSKIVKKFEKQIGVDFELNDNECFNPYGLLDYIYGYLHSNKYRETYSDFLKIDFPKVPYPSDYTYYEKIAILGRKLRKLHLLETDLDISDIQYCSCLVSTVNTIKYKDDKIYINSSNYFKNVEKSLWLHRIGGYEPLQKWLKDRKGRVLSEQDIEHYKKMIVAIQKTQDIMAQIDEIIEL